MTNLQKTTVLYHVVVDTKNEGSFYVGYTSIGGGVSQFYFSKSPVMELVDKNIAKHYKDLLFQTVKHGGDTLYLSEFVMIEDDFNYENVSEIKLQKQTITTIVEFEYI